MPRPVTKFLPDGPLPLDKSLRLKVLKDMVELMCMSILSEIYNDDSEVYKIIDTYIDSCEHKITQSEKDKIRETYKRVMEQIAITTKAVYKDHLRKKYGGGPKNKHLGASR